MIGYIYRISGGGKFYIGSTTQPIKKRLKNHKSKSKESHRKNTPIYEHFNNIGWSNVTIEVIQQIEFEEKIKLLEVEKEIINQYKNDANCLNKSRPFITCNEKKESDKKYYKLNYLQNKEREKERLRKWREENHDKYLEQAKRYRDKNKLSQNQ